MLLVASATVAALTSVVPASGLVARSATDATPNGDGMLVATAKCPGRKHVVSGGFKAEDNAVPVVSRAVGDRKWTVHLFPGSTEALKTVAYCGARRVSRHSKTKAADADTQVANKVAAKCDRGESVVSGGFRLIDTPPGDLDNNPVFKSRRTGKRTWGVSAFVDEPPAKVKAFAYCTRHLDVKVRSNQSDPIPTEGASDATASCHRSETLLSGGYTTTPKSDFSNDTGPDFFYFRSLRSGSRSWTATAHNYSDIAGQITTFAYCKA